MNHFQKRILSLSASPLLALLAFVLGYFNAHAQENYFVNPPGAGLYAVRATPKADHPNADAFIDFAKEDGNFITKLTVNTPMPVPPRVVRFLDLKDKPAAGTLLHVALKVRGNLVPYSHVLTHAGLLPVDWPTNDSDTISVKVVLTGSRLANVLPVEFPLSATGFDPSKPISGTFDWTTFEGSFVLPDKTVRIEVILYCNNATGEVDIKDYELEAAPAASSPTVQLAASLPAAAPVEERFAKEIAARATWWTAEKAKLGIPEGKTLYTPLPALSGPHPRYLFPQLPLAELMRRAKDPAYAIYVDSLRAQAKAFCVPPKKPNMAGEDPMRGYSDHLPWIALAYLLEEDSTQKQAYLQGVIDNVNAMSSWGPPEPDLPNSQMIFGFAATYDWLYDVLPADTKAKMRAHIIDCVRWMRSPASGAWQWRSEPQWFANHKWFNYSALGMAAAVLWGDKDAPLAPDNSEQQLWMDEAMEVFWVASKTHPADGIPMEGYIYQNYGMRPYIDFVTLLDPLVKLNYDIMDETAFRNLGVSRLHGLLPNYSGFAVWADGVTTSFDSVGAAENQFYASRFKDPEAQLVAQILLKVKPEDDPSPKPNFPAKDNWGDPAPNWRSLFFYDPSIPAAKITQEPLYRDNEDTGISMVRSSWTNPEATWLLFRCGPYSSWSKMKIFGQLASGHCYPNDGAFNFYAGSYPVIPFVSYPHTKLTGDHAITMIDGTCGNQKGQWIEQQGGGGQWFIPSHNIQSYPKMLRTEHHDNYHTYLGEIGGIFPIIEDQSTAPNHLIYPSYRRSITYLPSGVLIVVDKIEIETPHSMTFRLPTMAADITRQGQSFQFQAGPHSINVIDASPAPYAYSITKETVDSKTGDKSRTVLNLKAPSGKQTIFAVIIGVNGAEKGITVAADPEKIIISGAQKDPITLDWQSQAQLEPAP